MGQDSFCCFCGALASVPFWDREDDDEYDPDVLSETDTVWMGDVRLIGQNPDSRNLNKVFITGAARHDDYGFFEVEMSEDPNCPTPEQMESESNTYQLKAYTSDQGFPLTIPFHFLCYAEIFSRCVRRIESGLGRPSRTFDEDERELVYGTLAGLCPEEEFATCLEIDYGSVAGNQDQYWGCSRGEEAWVTDPHRIDALDRYYSQLLESPPEHQQQSQALELGQQVSQNSSDPFAALPAEILLKIALFLPMPSVNSLRAASNGVRALHLSNAFWRSRVLNDMPWLYDLPLIKLDQQEGLVNWATVYHDMLRKSEESSTTKINGLVNRRRIWMLCEGIATTYISRKGALMSANSDEVVETLEQATSSPMPRLLTTLSARFTSFLRPIAKNWQDLLQSQLLVSSEWNEDGILVDLKIEATAEESENIDTVFNESTNSSHQLQTARLGKAECILALVLTLRDGKPGCEGICGLEILTLHSKRAIEFGHVTGSKRLLNTSEGKVIVGIQGRAIGGVISGLSLLEAQPPDSLHGEFEDILTAQRKSHYNNTEIFKYMWKDSLPPPNISISAFKTGYWDYNFSIETSHVEHLIFGQCTQDFESITGFAGDFHIGGFRIEYSDRPAKSIGPVLRATTLFPIDGAHGERVVRFALEVSYVPLCLGLATNWGRVGLFGDSRERNWIDIPEGKILAGIAGVWSYGSRIQLKTAAMLTIPVPTDHDATSQQDELQEADQDAEGRFWEPCRPQSGWKEAGAIFGNNSKEDTEINTGGGHAIPTDTQRVGWLDCSKPVAKVETWFTHPSNSRYGQQPVSLIFHYGDNSFAAIGPSEFNLAANGDVQNCDCRSYAVSGRHFGPTLLGGATGLGATGLGATGLGAAGNDDGEEADMEDDNENDEEEEDENVDDDENESMDDEEDENLDDHESDEDEEGGETEDENLALSGDEVDNGSQEDDAEAEDTKDGDKEDEYTTAEWPYPRSHFFPGEQFVLGNGGEKLRILRIWSSDFIDGFQFVSESGIEGPKWGICDGQPAGSIIFASGSSGQAAFERETGAVVSGAVGLKVFLGPNARPVTYGDVIVFGFQALVEPDPR